MSEQEWRLASVWLVCSWNWEKYMKSTMLRYWDVSLMNMIGQMLLKCAISDTGWNQVDLIKLMGISPCCTSTIYTMSRCLCHENAWYHSYKAIPLLAGLILLSNDTILTQYDNLVWTYPNKPVSMWQPWLDHWHWEHQQVERQRYTASACAQSHSTAKLWKCCFWNAAKLESHS